MDRILVPTDFSENSVNALKVAAQLARKYDSEIYLLHVLELPGHVVDPVASSSSSTIPEAVFYMQGAHKRFESLMASDFLEGVKVFETVNSNFTKAYDGIIAGSKEHNVDMIVIGSHGSEGLEEILVGSNTEKVVRNSDVPVLVIKHEHQVFEVNDLVYATALEDEDKNSIRKAGEFAKELDAHLHLLYINTAGNFKSDDELDALKEEFLASVPLENFTLHVRNDKSVEKGILNFAQRINAGMIGISTHGRKGISHFFNGSISEDLVNHAHRPVLTFKI